MRRETCLPVVSTGGFADFNPLPPCGGRPDSINLDGIAATISIHSLRAEGDKKPLRLSENRQLFQSTPSVRRETLLYIAAAARASDFNPLPPCGGRPQSCTCLTADILISIHSLRAEGDFCYNLNNYREEYFNPLPPCGGRQTITAVSVHSRSNFNPLPPCGGRLKSLLYSVLYALISIHSLRAEGDLFPKVKAIPHAKFQSTPSVRRETSALRILSLATF